VFGKQDSKGNRLLCWRVSEKPTLYARKEESKNSSRSNGVKEEIGGKETDRMLELPSSGKDARKDNRRNKC